MTAAPDAPAAFVLVDRDLRPTGAGGAAPLLAADSWLVLDGVVRGLDLHRRRFERACTEAAGRPVDLSRFWDGVLDRLPRSGAWFPRVELTHDHSLRLLVRPAPPRGGPLRLGTPRPDPRALPRRKGPDLPVLLGVRDEVRAGGADDTLLVDDDGYVLESTTAGVLWWDGDVLCHPSPDLPVLQSVTTRLLLRHAHRAGTATSARHARPGDLTGHETWLVNALHGIRPVVDGPVPDTARLDRWQRELDASQRPLPSLTPSGKERS